MTTVYTVTVNDNGGVFWRNQYGELHREDGPAIEYSHGTKAWYLNGELHREDGPAFELSHGTKEWYLNGKRHREDGPAIELSNGTKIWYLNGVKYSEKNFNEKMNKTIEVNGKTYKLVE